MGFRFFRRVSLAPGLRLNLSKRGASFSLGKRGAWFTTGTRGSRATVGIPGTGLFYTKQLSSPSQGRSKPGRRARSVAGDDGLSTEPSSEERLTLGFFKRLITPKSEEAFADGCRELVSGKYEQAWLRLRESSHADGAFLTGIVSLKLERHKDAIVPFITAFESSRHLGEMFDKYGISAAAHMAITDEVTALIEPNKRGILLALVEAYQHLGQLDRAAKCLRQLKELSPDDPVVKLSLAELLLETAPKDRQACQQVVKLADGIENDTPIHAALLLYKARALRGLELPNAARDVLSACLRRKRERSDELIWALRYERALAYEDLGQDKRARSDLERLYAECSDYEDVAVRLGLSTRRSTVE